MFEFHRKSQSEHKRGERFEGNIDVDINLPAGYHLVYAGERRMVKEGDWFVLHEGWWVFHLLEKKLVRFHEGMYLPVIRSATLDDLSFTRKDVKMWAWETGCAGDIRISTSVKASVIKRGGQITKGDAK